ncbi:MULTISPECIES: S41 family peptidase [unclassified Pseudoalteromonas]|uniref:S41 family peptidase n=1 Tax=unclassified Pseudoalteromonas TaxID=194690 RepID=UPI0005A63DF5|nr:MULTISPECIES: S41 family peptidase [unclassified Pseudoalteromonas]
MELSEIIELGETQTDKLAVLDLQLAEIFSIAMRARDNSALIGQSTGGGLSDILPKSLPHGLQYSISNEFYISHDGLEFEGTGVPVSIEKAFLL